MMMAALPRTTRTVHEMARDLDAYMPLTEGVHKILFEGVPPRDVLSELMDITRYVYEV